MKNNELKPCPACGGEAGLKPYSGDGNSCLGLSYAHVACMSCKLTSKTFQRVYQNEHEKTDAIKAWNNRPIEDDLKRQLAEAQELVKELEEFVKDFSYHFTGHRNCKTEREIGEAQKLLYAYKDIGDLQEYNFEYFQCLDYTADKAFKLLKKGET